MAFLTFKHLSTIAYSYMTCLFYRDSSSRNATLFTIHNVQISKTSICLYIDKFNTYKREIDIILIKSGEFVITE